MEFRRVLAFILTTAMLLGNTVPAYATGVDGNGVTVVDEGDIKTTDVSEDGEEVEEGDVAGQNENDGGSDESGAGNDDGGGDYGGGNNQGSSDSGDNEGDSNGDSSNIGDGEGNPDDKNEGDDSAQNGATGEDNEGDSNNGTHNGDSNGEGSDEDDSNKSEGNDNGDENFDGDGTDSGVDGEDPADGDEKNPENGEDGEESGDSENPGEDEENLDGEEEPEDEEGLEGEEESEELEDEEDSLSDNSVSENDISVSVNELPMKTTGESGYVSIEGSQKTYPTIGEAIADIKNVTQNTSVTISLPQKDSPGYGEKYYISGEDLVANSAYNVTLQLNGNIIYAEADKDGNKVVKSNVSFNDTYQNGDAGIHLVESGMTFQILEKPQTQQGLASISIQNVNFTGNKTGTLQIGGNTSDDTEELRAAYVSLSQTTFGAFKEIKIYDGCSFDCSIEVDKLTIDLGLGDASQSADCETANLSDTKVKELYLKGSVSWRNGGADEVSVSEKTTIVTKPNYPAISLSGTSQFNNLKIEGDSSLKLNLCTYARNEIEKTTNLKFGGTITANGKPIEILCQNEIAKKEKFDADDTIATIVNENTRQPISVKLFQAEGMAVVREGNELKAKEKNFRVTYTQQTEPGLVEYGIYSDVASMVTDMKLNTKNEYQVHLLKDYELSNGEYWNFSGLNVTLVFVNGNDLSVAEGATAAITVDSINGSGATQDGILWIKNGARLNIQGDLHSVYNDTRLEIREICVKTAEGDDVSAALALGNQENGKKQQVSLSACDFSNCDNLNLELHGVTLISDDFPGCDNVNLELYGNVNWDPDLRVNRVSLGYENAKIDMELDGYRVTLGSLKVNNSGSEIVNIGRGISVSSLEVEGNLKCDILTAQTTEMTTGSRICTTKQLELNQITVRGKYGAEVVSLVAEDIYKAKGTETEKVYFSNIILGDSLVFDESANKARISFDKSAVKVTDTGAIQAYAEGTKIAQNYVLATVNVTPETGTGVLLKSQSYAVEEIGFIASIENKDGSNKVVAKDSINQQKDIFVNERNTGVNKFFADLQEVRRYIFEEANEKSDFEIILNKITSTVSGNDLDYSELTAENVTLDLNGFELKLKNNQIVSVDEIDGYNENQVSGKLTLNSNNTLKPRQEELLVKGAQLKPNSTSLTIGTSTNLANSSVIIREAGNAISLKNLTVYGKIDWQGDTSKTLTVADTLTRIIHETIILS